MTANDEVRGALDGIRVVDLTTNHTGYAARLLSDLGAHVTRPSITDNVARNGQDYAETFLHAGKHRVALDPACAEFRQLIAESDLIFESSAFGPSPVCLAPTDLIAVNPRATIVSFSPYGMTNEETTCPATDLTILAAGGLLSLGGYVETEPIAVDGEQSLLGAGIFGAVAALADLVGRTSRRSGNWIDVSAQECVAFALEDAVPHFYINRRVRRRFGDAAREAGTGVYPCADGFVSIVAGRLGTARAWAALRGWILEVGAPGSEDLNDSEWDNFAFRGRPENVQRFAEIFAAFGARYSKRSLYVEGQKRQIAIAPVNNVDDLFDDPQLVYSGYFRDFLDSTGRKLRMPGAPYRLSATPARIPATEFPEMSHAGTAV